PRRRGASHSLVIAFGPIPYSRVKRKPVAAARSLPFQRPGFVHLAGVNLGPDIRHGDQQPLQGIEPVAPPSSVTIWPADLEFALPMIALVNRSLQSDRDLDVRTVNGHRQSSACDHRRDFATRRFLPASPIIASS